MSEQATEIEQEVERKAFVSIMGELVNALGKGGLDVTFDLDGKEIHIPAEKLAAASFEVELEDDGEECELELSIEWKK